MKALLAITSRNEMQKDADVSTQFEMIIMENDCKRNSLFPFSSRHDFEMKNDIFAKEIRRSMR